MLSATFVFTLLYACTGSAPLYTLPGASAASGTNPTPQIPSTGVTAIFSSGKIIANIYPRRGEGYIDIALRISNEPKQWQKLKTWNRNRRFPQIGRPIRVPYSYLNDRYRLLAVERLFPKDRLTGKGWQHIVRFRGETMWFIAEIFTGDGANYPAIQRANGFKKGQPIGLGNKIIIPNGILGDEFSKSFLPEDPDLKFEKGSDGKLYAVYRLKQGEALYSAVVVRYTGRVDADDVNEMAEKLLKLNGLSDPRKIPTGKAIRIPFDYLSDDFLTSGAPSQRIKVDRSRARGRSLHVILDPGHGGSDPGVNKGSVTEDELSYDVMLRVKSLLLSQGVHVYTTVEDPRDDGKPKNSSRLSNSKSERVKTTPPYTILDSRVSVNMRVYLVNAIYRNLKKRRVPDKNIFFISIHMDHLHPSMRGAMIYYPAEGLRSKSFKANGRIYGRYAESRGRRISFGRSEARKAASYSYDFARDLVRALKRKKVSVHSHRPIRPYVYRRNRKWTPAVLRYSKVPSSVLLEVVNMANRGDLRRIRDYRFRQRVAEAIVDAIL